MQLSSHTAQALKSKFLITEIEVFNYKNNKPRGGVCFIITREKNESPMLD
jgi:hypothetical protein